MLKNVFYTYSFLRSLNYLAQGSLLPFVEFAATKKYENRSSQIKEQLALTLPKLEKLFKSDAKNIDEGMYPASVLIDDTPWSHYGRIPSLLQDAYRAAKQRQEKKAHVFTNGGETFLEEVPTYFQRNFHFQKDGYLSDRSAALYEHQVEVLFSGSANAMRRMIIPELKKHFNSSNGDGLSFLEIGSGTGSLTRFIAMAFPKAQITCVDLSPHYLARARMKLKSFKRINYVQGCGEDLKFKDQTFDAVFSCYLFHELPEEVRVQVLKEKYRVLKPIGFMAVMDSIQKNDDESLDWALRQFPVQFHEPFYKNYIENSLEDAVAATEVHNLHTAINFLTKIVTATKPAV